MGRRVRETDWSQTPLGDYQTWPQSLRSSLSLVLNTKGIAALYWGPDQWLLYNDAYGEALSDRHPWAFGRSMPQVLSDIAPVLGPQVARVLATGEGFAIENLSMVMRRHGRNEETVWTYGFSPVQGETEEFAGVLLVATEMTQQVLAEQHSRANETRQRYRIELGDALRSLSDPGQIQAEACRLLCNILDASRVHYAEMEDDGEHAVVPHDHAATVPNRAGRYRLADFTTLIRACRSGQTCVVADIALDDEIAASEKALLAALPVSAIILVPLVKDMVLEAFLAVHSATPRVWSAEEIELAEETAERTWAAIERSRAEVRLRTLNATLQERIDSAMRDQAVIEEALRQSQKMDAIGQLTGGIAHDFNNMLATITSSLELMNRRIASGKGGDLTRYLTLASTASQSAAALIKRLLAFSRKQTLDLQSLDVNASIAQMEDMLKRSIGEQVQFELALQPGLPSVRSDLNQLENALLNLTINARDAMPEGGLIRISTSSRELDASYAAMHPEVAPGPYVMVSVSDNGMGMSPEVVAKAFDPFFTTKPIGQGTGLGLSMIYGFVRQTQGHASIHSVQGEGTTVNIYLPCNLTGFETPVTQHQLVARSPKGRGETVLYVEDEPGVRAVLGEILGELGYITHEAIDAASALHIEQTLGQLDLLITDVGLPGTNGRQLAEMMRERRPGLRVLFVTGYANKAPIKGEFLGRGMDMLAKPFTIDVLAHKVQSILREPIFDGSTGNTAGDADSAFTPLM
jgi:signal transduction histidine kinase/CheY-like chemotaxis protein